MSRGGAVQRHDAVWTVSAAGEGTHIRYELQLDPAMRLPRRVVMASSRRSVQKLFDRLAVELERGAPRG